MSTLTASTPSEASALLRSELTKTFTTRLWWALLIGVVAMTGLQAVVTAAIAGSAPGPGAPPTPPLDDPQTIRSVYANAPFVGAYLFALVMGVTAMTGEYRYQTVTPTFLATPRRARVIAAKAVAQLGLGASYGVVAVLVALVGAGTVMVIRGYSLSYDTPGLWRAVLLAVLAVAMWTLLGLGIGTLIRNQVAAILVALALGIIIEPLLGLLLSAIDLDSLARLLPSAASSAMTSPASQGVDLLPWWGGALVMVGYSVVFAGLGILLSVRRDIT
jgi:ABC-2 type transport system permease protein